MKKNRVAVLLGGRSNEREISLESGRNVIHKLSPQSYEPIALFVSNNLTLHRLPATLLVANSTQEIENQLGQCQQIGWHELTTIADFVFIALHGGEGENGCIQGALEMLELPYNGSPILPSALCMDKFRTNMLLRAEGFDVPDHYLVTQHTWTAQQPVVIKQLEEQLSYPCIVKPHDDGCSVMVTKAKNRQELIENINAILSNNKTAVLVEEFIQGIELTVGVMGNEHITVLPPSQAIAASSILSIQEKFLPGAGENQTPAPIGQQACQLVQQTIEKVYSAVQCKGYARIDCFYQPSTQSKTGKERVVVLEINTLPGLTPATCIFHQAAEIGLKPMDFIDRIIKLGFERHSNKTIPLTHERVATQQEVTIPTREQIAL